MFKKQLGILLTFKSVELTPLFYCVLKSVDMSCVDITPSDMTSADNEKRLKDMPSEGHRKLIVLLQPKDLLGNDYRILADKLGYKNEYIKYLESTDEPVKTLIKEKGDMKVVELIPMLEDMKRKDVVEDIQKSLSRFAFIALFSVFDKLLSLYHFYCITYFFNYIIVMIGFQHPPSNKCPLSNKWSSLSAFFLTVSAPFQ